MQNQTRGIHSDPIDNHISPFAAVYTAVESRPIPYSVQWVHVLSCDIVSELVYIVG